MAEKQSIFGRISQLVRANINALLDSAEDPEKLLDQLIRDFSNEISEAETTVAQTIGNLRLAERDYQEDVDAAADWGKKAAAASAQGEALRASGDNTGADKFDNLAKVAIGKQIQFEKEASDAQPLITSQREVVAKLEAGLTNMRNKLVDLRSRRDSLVARQKTAQAQVKVQDALASINVMDPTSELSRFEEKIRQQEALAQGKAEVASLGTESFEAQFASLEASNQEAEIAARLAALKQQG